MFPFNSMFEYETLRELLDIIYIVSAEFILGPTY